MRGLTVREGLGPCDTTPFRGNWIIQFTLQKVFAKYPAILVRVSVAVVPFGVKVSS